MTRNKPHLVLRYIRFDEKATQAQRRGTDKFAAIRQLWESVILNCQNSFFPHANVIIDKQLFHVALDVFLYSTCLKSLQSLELNFG